MPVDQQPCTTAFCEVHDAAENNGREEVHVLIDGLTYDINDDSTFSRKNIADLEHIIAENPSIIKLYLEDTRTPSESLLNNGVVDISLIDAPGLNRDSLQTTALFARQEEIDVVTLYPPTSTTYWPIFTSSPAQIPSPPIQNYNVSMPRAISRGYVRFGTRLDPFRNLWTLGWSP